MKKRVIGIILVFCMVFSMLPMMAFAAESGSRYVLEQEIVTEAIFSKIGGFNEGYAPVQDSSGKWGYINKAGEIVVECKYDWANYYREGVALVGVYSEVWSEQLEDYYDGTEFYLIDMKGKEIKLDTSSKPCLNQLDSFNYTYSCINGVINVCGVPFTADGKLIEVKNPEVLELTGYYEYMDGTTGNAYDYFVMSGIASEDGLISMETDGVGQMSAYQNFIMDIEGNIVRSFDPRDIDYSYSGVDNVWLAEDGMLIIRSAGYEEQWWESSATLSYRVEDAYGNVLIPEGSFTNFLYMTDGRFFSDGLLIVKGENEKYGAMNAEGELVIDFIYDDMAPFGGGYAPAGRNGELIYVDTKGNEYEVVGVNGEKANLDDASSFTDGFAWVHDSEGFYYLISDRHVDGKLYPVENSVNTDEIGATFYERDGLYGVCNNTVTEKKADVPEVKVGDSFIYVDDTKLELSKPIIDIYEITYEEYVLLPDELQNEFGTLRERVEKTAQVYVLEKGTEVSFPYAYTWGAAYSYLDFEGTGVYGEDMGSGGYTPDYWYEEIVLPVKWTLNTVNDGYISCWDISEMPLDKNGDYIYTDGMLKRNFEGKLFYEVREIAQHVHEYESVVTAPTCTEEGYTTHTCACGDSYKDSTVAATGHKWDGGKVTTEPTEEKEGVKTFTCTVCSETKTEVIAPLAHEHEYVAEVVAPTCTEDGFTTHTCACGDSYTDTTVPATGHKWDDGKVTTEPTEETEGVKTFTCTVCSETKTEVIAQLGHTHKYTSEVTAPTCTEDGFTTHTCDCGDSYTDTTVPATGHKWDGGKVTKEPTFYVEGERLFTCLVCGSEKTETIEKKPGYEHECIFVVTEYKEPTCSSEGYEGHTCTICGGFALYTIPLIPHSWDGGKVTTEPTIETNGVKTFTCTVCGETKTEKINKLPDPNAPVENPFTDVAEKDFFFQPVMWAVANNVTSGLSATSFGPGKGCTRAQVVTFLWRAAGEPAPTSDVNPFADVKEGQYYYDAVLWAVENGITTGLNATTFGTNADCNRGQIVTFLWRAMGKPAPQSDANPFGDVPNSQYYYDAVLWAVEKGITTGLSATSFGPNSTCTRGQIVTFLYRAYQ